MTKEDKGLERKETRDEGRESVTENKRKRACEAETECVLKREPIKTRGRKRTRSWDAPSFKEQENKTAARETGKEEGRHPGE